MFVDKVNITVRAGNGGNGVVSFHREKYVTNGGPDGGDGGRGGSIVLRADPNMSTLMDFRYKRKYVAQNGSDGSGKRCSGRDGEDLVIRVYADTTDGSGYWAYIDYSPVPTMSKLVLSVDDYYVIPAKKQSLYKGNT